MIPELTNKLVMLGIQVVFGCLDPDRAIENVRSSPEFSSATDAGIRKLIDETDRYWREHLEAAVAHPENVAIYPVLMAACAEERLKAIGAYRKGCSAAEQPDLDRRMAEWISLTARCELARGMTLLLFPRHEEAWKAFSRANAMARALPDSGVLRLRETLWAAFGQRLAASLGGQDGLATMANQELNGLMNFPGREAEAREYLAEIEKEFETLREVFNRRMRHLNDGSPDSETPVSTDLGCGMAYIKLLNSCANYVIAGKLEMHEAQGKLAEEVDISRLRPLYLYLQTMLHRQLAESNPDAALILATLNRGVAILLGGDLAETTRAYASYALGKALLTRGRRDNDPVMYADAFRPLEEARAFFDKDDGEDSGLHAAVITLDIAMCLRGSGEMEHAAVFNRDAIVRWEALSRQRPETPLCGSNLGAAHGNLADVLEQLGEMESAFRSHYLAFQQFVAANNLPHARRALSNIIRLCQRANRTDDAAAALAKMTEAARDVADVSAVVHAYLGLVAIELRTNRFEQAFSCLAQLEKMLQPLISVQDPPNDLLSLYVDYLVYDGLVSTLLLNLKPDRLSDALSGLEEARRIAAWLQDHERLATVVLQTALLYVEAGMLDQAERYCDMAELIPCGSDNLARSHEIRGGILLDQGRLPESLVSLERALETYGPEHLDRLMITRFLAGCAHEGLGAQEDAARSYEAALDIFEQSRAGLYEESRIDFALQEETILERLVRLYASGVTADPVRALELVEKGKSRTFSETIGLSGLAVAHPPDAIRADLTEERNTIDQLNHIRDQLFISKYGSSDRLELLREMDLCHGKLAALWPRISPFCPEYVELRQGRAMKWYELIELLDEGKCCTRNRQFRSDRP